MPLSESQAEAQHALQQASGWKDRFDSLFGSSDTSTHFWMIISVVLCALSVLLFLSRLFVRPPRKLLHFLAGVFGAACGAHATVQAIYFYWNSDGSEAPLVYGLIAGNRDRWCSDPSSCKIFYSTYCILIIVSLITQYLVYSGFKEVWSDKVYAAVPFKHPRGRSVSFRDDSEASSTDEEAQRCTPCRGCAVDQDDQTDTWLSNLHTPRSCWIFLTVVVTMSCVASVCFTFIVKWAGTTNTNFLVALIYILTNAFCLWSIIEFFVLTLWFHVIRLFCGMPPLPKMDFRTGVPPRGRTIMAYCLLSKSEDSSKECFETAREAHLANLDPNMRITTSIVSVTSALHLVKNELDLRDRCRAEIRERLTGEMNAILQISLADSYDDEHRKHVRDVLQAVSESSVDRLDFWLTLIEPGKGPVAQLPQRLAAKVDEAVQHFVYLHRTCKILNAMAAAMMQRALSRAHRAHGVCCCWRLLLAAGAAVLLGRAPVWIPGLGHVASRSPATRARTTVLKQANREMAEQMDSDADDFYSQDNEELMAMLMSGQGDEVDILGNGSLVKNIISPAPAFSRRPQLGDEVTVHFIGSLEDGTVFDDTRARHEPYTFRVGLGFVIGGWDKGIPTMMKGERSLFLMDSSVAYGAQGAGWKIPPNATVRFDIELLGWEEIDDMGPDDVEPEWEAPLVGRDDVGEGGKGPNGKYTWERNGLEVVVKAQIPDDTVPKDIKAEFFPKRIFVSVKGETLLTGTPGLDLDWEECYWDMSREEEIQDDPQAKLWLLIHLHKKDAEKAVPCIQSLVTPDHSHIGSDIDIAMRYPKPAAFTRPLTPGQHDSMICQIAGVRDHVGPQEMEKTKRWKQRKQLLRGANDANVALQLWPLGNYSKYHTATSAEIMFWRLRAGNSSQTKGAAACRKPGQYQDLMILGSTGNNQAYTYLNLDYGSMGREKDSDCFGFSGNVSAGPQENGSFDEAVKLLQARGRPDIDLVASFGSDSKNRYHYTMVLDSDTICPAGSIRQLIECAEHPANRAFGIVNANLAVDYTSSDSDCTWHMWRNALMEVSTVNLVRGQFWIFNRTGFYGKGLVRNSMYISRLIGMPGRLVEALPIDILSHDTVEAKLLQPAVDIGVTLYEDVARNPISALSQSTRWMLGEVRNACYHPDGSYRGIISTLTNLYAWLVECKPRQKVYVRWRDVPCSVAAEYLSHTGFRLFHAGPGILLVNIATSLLANQRWLLELNVLPVVGMSAFLFTVIALFIIPKGFLMLDKLPSLNLGKFLLCSTKASKIGDGMFSSEDEDEPSTTGLTTSVNPRTFALRSEEDSDADSDMEGEEEKLGRCSVLMRQMALAIVEILLSILLFSPELIIGVVRLVRGSWAQLSLPFLSSRPWIMAPSSAEAVAFSMEAVDSIPQPREDRDFHQEWKKLQDKGAIARATFRHNLQAHEDEEINSVLSSFGPLPMWMLVDDPVSVVEIAKDTEMQGAAQPPIDLSHITMTLEEQPAVVGPWCLLYFLEGFPTDFSCISKRAADQAKQPTQVYQIYKKQLQQDRLFSVEYSYKRQCIGHSSHRLDPGQSEAKLMGRASFAANASSPWTVEKGVTGTQNWQPQDAVEKEVQQNLSFFYVFKKTWLVFACGVAYLVYAIIFGIHDALVFLLIISWVGYPFTTYWMCMPVHDMWRRSFLWKWVMEVKRSTVDTRRSFAASEWLQSDAMSSALVRRRLTRLASLHALRRFSATPSPGELERSTRSRGWWSSFVQLSYKWLGSSLFDKKADICNCGGDFGVPIPRAELLRRDNMEKGSREERMQLYGGALYWHLATTLTEKYKDAQPDMLRDKDVLEVACMRGGGARYLSEITGPKRYLAIDHVPEHIEQCRRKFGEWPGLEFEVMDAHELAEKLPADSFDFVICIQAAASFEQIEGFVEGVGHVLRKGGRLLLADALTRSANTKLLDSLEDHGFDVELSMDISRHVHAVGVCAVPTGLSYVHVVARKE
ncbi:FKBP65 [Symbiodinium sp. KB8]|nr:FKBP65 [Symbiodinium sp. KB8]